MGLRLCVWGEEEISAFDQIPVEYLGAVSDYGGIPRHLPEERFLALISGIFARSGVEFSPQSCVVGGAVSIPEVYGQGMVAEPDEQEATTTSPLIEVRVCARSLFEEIRNISESRHCGIVSYAVAGSLSIVSQDTAYVQSFIRAHDVFRHYLGQSLTEELKGLGVVESQ